MGEIEPQSGVQSCIIAMRIFNRAINHEIDRRSNECQNQEDYNNLIESVAIQFEKNNPN